MNYHLELFFRLISGILLLVVGFVFGRNQERDKIKKKGEEEAKQNELTRLINKRYYDNQERKEKEAQLWKINNPSKYKVGDNVGPYKIIWGPNFDYADAGHCVCNFRYFYGLMHKQTGEEQKKEEILIEQIRKAFENE